MVAIHERSAPRSPSGDSKVSLGAARHTDGVHVMGPDHEADESNCDHCLDHSEVAEDRLATESEDNMADASEAR
jgi:hypothetical protein